MKSRNTKRQKTTRSQEDSTVNSPCHLTKIPLELLAEILLYTKSPRDILSVARCSKFLCNTLLHPTNQSIWRYARQNCLPQPLPEPHARLTESSYAAFVYDQGKCESCGQETQFYSSFALRLRLCPKTECKKFVDKLGSAQGSLLYTSDNTEAYRIFENTLPVVESEGCFSDSIYGIRNWPGIPLRFRSTDWSKALQEYLDASGAPDTFQKYIDRCAARSAHNQEHMKLCTALYSWKTKFLERAKTTKIANETFSRTLAAKEGLNFWDLLNTPTYCLLYKTRNKTLEDIQQQDYDARLAVITAELVKVKEKRGRRVHEVNYAKARALVEKQYERLRTAQPPVEAPLPSLPTFRELPTIRQLQHSGYSDQKLNETLKSPAIQDLIRSDLTQWRKETRNALGATLGYPNWNSPSDKKLHPVDRMTARFLCRTCQRVEMKYKDDGCLDYAGVCRHVCSTAPDKPPLKPKPFKLERFVKDDKAAAAVASLLTACDAPEDDVGSQEVLKKIGARILCLSCDAQIVMEPSAVIGHSHRHESMSVELLSGADAKKILFYPLSSERLASRLIGKGKAAPVLRQKKVYGCRHCAQIKPRESTSKTSTPVGTSLPVDKLESTTKTSAPVATSLPVDNPSTNTAVASTSVAAVGATAAVPSTSDITGHNPESADARKSSLFSFDGLRSHLKDKHKVMLPREEDFYCAENLPWPTP